MSCIVSFRMEKDRFNWLIHSNFLLLPVELCPYTVFYAAWYAYDAPADTDVLVFVALLVHNCSEMRKKTDLALVYLNSLNRGWDLLIFLVSLQKLWIFFFFFF